jgi:hypothetical protein
MTTPRVTELPLRLAPTESDPFIDLPLEVQRHFDISEHTGTPPDDACVPHTLILSPGLAIEKVYDGHQFWGRPSDDQLWAELGDLFGRIEPDFDPSTSAARAAWEESQRVTAGVRS